MWKASRHLESRLHNNRDGYGKAAMVRRIYRTSTSCLYCLQSSITHITFCLSTLQRSAHSSILQHPQNPLKFQVAYHRLLRTSFGCASSATQKTAPMRENYWAIHLSRWHLLLTHTQILSHTVIKPICAYFYDRLSLQHQLHLISFNTWRFGRRLIRARLLSQIARIANTHGI